MSDLIPAPRARAQSAPDVARTVETLATLVIIILTVGVLFVAREILVPIVIAILLSFVLSPLVKGLRQLGLPKTLSVGLVVLSSFLLSVGTGAILAKQISDLVSDAPRYQETVTHKADGVRAFVSDNPILRKINTTLSDVSRMAPLQSDSGKGAKAGPQPASSGTPGKAPQTSSDPERPMDVRVVQPAPGIIDILREVAGTAASPIATAAFVAIFIVFMLMQREDLRNRFIRLVGSSDLQRTTMAMNDAARRLSRYFLAQMLLNTAFGCVVAVALTLIGVPGAILWGIVAILMRFIPYIGSFGAALFPVLLAAAANPGWSMAIETAVFFVIFELLVGQVVEPLIYGHNTGISPIAVVISATFWTWLWGPIGLVLSTPLTVCLVVIGRHVERLAFFDIILGDAPALTPIESFYQRVLAGDISEVSDHADLFLREHSLEDYCDEVALPALLLAQRDARRDRLDEDRLVLIRDTVTELMDDLFDRDIGDVKAAASVQVALGKLTSAVGGDVDAEREAQGQPSLDPAWQSDAAILCIAGRDALDEAAATILAGLLRQRSLGAHVEPAIGLSATSLPHLVKTDAKLAILSFLDPDLSVAQARFTVRRIRRRIPDIPIIVALWADTGDSARLQTFREEIRCDVCISSFAETVDLCVRRASSEAIDIAA